VTDQQLRTGSEWAALVEPALADIVAGSSQGLRARTMGGWTRLKLAGVLADVPVPFESWRDVVITSLMCTGWYRQERDRAVNSDEYMVGFLAELSAADDPAKFASGWGLICEAAVIEQVQIDLGDPQALLDERARLLHRIVMIDAILEGHPILLV
jgi:hypothetical protein